MNRYTPVTRYSDGNPYRVFLDYDLLMRIPPNILKSCIYIYPSVASAKARERTGGSGFLLHRATPRGKGLTYIVTNWHVIAQCSENPAVMLNNRQGTFIGEPIEIHKSSWIKHKGGDDIALCLIELPNNADAVAIEENQLVDQDNLKIDSLHLGPGDNTYMVGRFTTHENNDAMTPIVRYGNISLNPNKHARVENPFTSHKDEVFLVETRSFSGYS